jgi:hypothetical protein
LRSGKVGTRSRAARAFTVKANASAQYVIQLTSVVNNSRSALMRGDLVLKKHEAIEYLLRTRGTPGDVYVDRNDLIDARKRCVIVVKPTRRRAGTERNDPFGGHHLLVDTLQNGRLFAFA